MAAVKEARQRLEGMEDQYPCATWLPVLCQHSATAPLTWQQLGRQGLPTRFRPIRGISMPSAIAGLGITLASTLLLLGIRHLGLLQAWELRAYDHLMQKRPVDHPDDRILIVTVSEADLKERPAQKSGADSLPDSQLVQLLDQLAQHQPRSVGLDVFRPQTAKSASPKLVKHLQRSNFFGICQVEDASDTNHPDIAPPPVVSVDRQGFSDVVLDPDNVLRRALLVMGPPTASQCQTQYALSAQLAFHFLEQQGIAVSYTEQNELQLGSAIVPRVPNPPSTYPRVDARQGWLSQS